MSMPSWMRSGAFSASRSRYRVYFPNGICAQLLMPCRRCGYRFDHSRGAAVAEVGDFTRFANPRQLMAYFGLIPGEQSSGETIRRGGITKTGNAHARRALVEAAWAYRMKARIGRHKVDRIEALPKVVRDIAWRAQLRLCTRYRRLSARAARPPTSSMSPSHARWWVSSGRSPARFNPRQKRHDPYLTFNGQLEEEITTQDQPRRGMRRWGGQCRGALVSRL